jgi:hypothetical protein
MGWDPTRTVSELPEDIHIYFREEAYILYSDMQEHTLNIVLIEPPEHYMKIWDGQKFRAAQKHNPYWYSELYEKVNTKRGRVLSALERIIKGGDRSTKKFPYPRIESELRLIILRRLAEGYDPYEELYGKHYSNGYVQPNPLVVQLISQGEIEYNPKKDVTLHSKMLF